MTNDICNKCAELKKKHSALILLLEQDVNKGGKIKQKQLELKRDYVKMLTADFVGYDKVNSIHYCYRGCENNINKEGETK